MTTPPRKAHYNSHFAISPALRRDIAQRTRRLSGHSVSTTRHSANGIASCVGPQLDHARGATKVDHRALLCRDETSWREVHRARQGCTAGFVVESIAFQGSVASWCVRQNGGLYQCQVPAVGTTGPEMDPKKFALWTGAFRSATLPGSPLPAGLKNSSSSTPVAGARQRSAGCPERAARPAMRSASWWQTSWCGSVSDRSPRCVGAFPVRSTVLLRCVGGVSCPFPNRARCRRCGQGEREEIRFLETSAWKVFLLSDASASRCGALTSPASRSLRRPAARIARPTSTSKARRLRLTRSSWSCSTSYVRASAPWVEGEPRECDGSAWDRLPPLVKSFECRSESNQRQSRNGWGLGSRKTIYRRNGVASRRDCRAAVCPRGDEPRGSIPAAGYAALGRGPRNPRSLITGSGAGLAISGRSA